MIICDTNIWYDLGSGRISEEIIKRKDLACTHLTLNELHHSHNLLSDYQSLRNAVKAIKKHASKIYWSNPFEFSISKLNSDYQPKTDNGVSLWRRIQVVLFAEIKIPLERVGIAEKFFENSNKPFEDFISEMNEAAGMVKKNIREQKLKRRRRNENDSHRIKQFLANLLMEYGEANYGKADIKIDVDSLAWNKFEFCMNVMSDFFKDIDVSPTQKIHSNDYADMFNMVYVGKGDLYWTNEKKWLRLIQSNPDASKYLFKPATCPFA